MAGGSREVGIMKKGLLAATLVGGLALPVQAAELGLSATTVFTTDYIFRGYSLTSQNPAVQPEFDLTYGIFYAGIWGSNTTLDGSVEIDYYAGIAPTWKGIAFNIGGLAYTYPSTKPAIDYFEAKTGASYTFGEKLTIGVVNYWSPDYAQLGFEEDAVEGAIAYAFSGKLFNFFSPSISALVGYQWFEEDIPNYVYWNAGLTLGFMEHWSLDVRYWDTDYSKADCVILIGERSSCDGRVVGTVKAVF